MEKQTEASQTGREVFLDGKGMILGRASSQIAKRLLDGEKIHIVNSEQMIITGNPMATKEKYTARRRRGSVVSGPFFPIRPDLVVRRTIRGMLPYKTNKGRAAFKNLRVHIGVPGGINISEKSEPAKIKTRYITVGKLSESLGWDKKK